MMSNVYVRQDEQGVLRVGDTHVMLDSIIAGFEQGHSAETLQSQYPALTLEEVYGAVAYYLGHMQEVQDYLRRQDAVWDEWRHQIAQNPSPVAARLRAMRKTGATQAP